MRIARVFPRKTSMSPTDEDAYFGQPPMNCPKYDQVHISVTFTWDVERANFLSYTWRDYGRVSIGGPAFLGKPNRFTPGLYLKKGIVITSRGCPNKCSFCLVPRPEGQIRELAVHKGNNIADNNLLACSKEHTKKVFKMLQGQKSIKFSGGFQASLVTDDIVEQLRDLSIKSIWVAYDDEGYDDYKMEIVRRAVDRLRKYFTREQIRCYVLIGYEGDTIDDAERRLVQAWNMGTVPFAMRYRKPVDNFADSFVYREREWNLLTREWTRPSITRAIMKART